MLNRDKRKSEYEAQSLAAQLSASADERHRDNHSMTLNQKIIPFLILCLLQLGDLFSTRLALKVPGVIELNPLVREFGLWQAKMLVFGLIVLLAWQTKRMRRLWTLCGIYAVIVASNVMLFVNHA